MPARECAEREGGRRGRELVSLFIMPCISASLHWSLRDTLSHTLAQHARTMAGRRKTVLFVPHRHGVPHGQRRGRQNHKQHIQNSREACTAFPGGRTLRRHSSASERLRGLATARTAALCHFSRSSSLGSIHGSLRRHRTCSEGCSVSTKTRRHLNT